MRSRVAWVHHLLTLSGLGLLWMLGWGALGAALSVVVGILDPPSIDAGEGPADLARVLGGVGALTGLAFGVLLEVAERRRALPAVVAWRAMLWGALAGVAVPLLNPAINDTVVLNTAPLGALTALASVVAARRVARARTA